MAEESKRTRRTKAEVLTEKLEKARSDKEKYEQKAAELDQTIKQLEDELNAENVDLLLETLKSQNLSVQEAIDKLKA